MGEDPARTVPAAGESPAKGSVGANQGSDKADKGQKQDKSPKQDKGQKQGAVGAKQGAVGAKQGSVGPKQASEGAKQGSGGARKDAARGRDGGGEGKPKAAPVADPPGYKPRLKVLFTETVAKDLREEFSYKSVMQIPRLSKIIVSTGLGEAIVNKKLLDSAAAEMTQITGRKPVRTKAKKSIANFKVRKGMDLGLMVTLRGNVMYEFFDRLINVAMPRIKDFRGANPNAFDGHGNYSLGVTEQIIFPEIDYDKIERVSGMNIAVVTTARTDQEARSLLARMGMPFRK
jgi:large subunit ribosomal protein L5